MELKTYSKENLKQDVLISCILNAFRKTMDTTGDEIITDENPSLKICQKALDLAKEFLSDLPDSERYCEVEEIFYYHGHSVGFNCRIGDSQQKDELVYPLSIESFFKEGNDEEGLWKYMNFLEVLTIRDYDLSEIFEQETVEDDLWRYKVKSEYHSIIDDTIQFFKDNIATKVQTFLELGM